ncbi:uncharacterized protein PGTG_19083 [Puccinia graminis f. sp. tritici CRL 75-36-700-3]|uniref:Uncharacterized protein n=1 Tax=Puccinia graminis f. sp. tritici (strain CRL 75-36-700-3 / race SCCL) TaxID=418459 RepID=E3L9X5_PUCGT|nr:uncharacterized protein PGTG_19083 [Puccinia graminis f. sp. tritici CRL 75-36-700-3]EFP93350.2 hypothetical protein PGTG_19083 [Puccinia graminis f. sp. tritici CRL 75-36-700-3]
MSDRIRNRSQPRASSDTEHDRREFQQPYYQRLRGNQEWLSRVTNQTTEGAIRANLGYCREDFSEMIALQGREEALIRTQGWDPGSVTVQQYLRPRENDRLERPFHPQAEPIRPNTQNYQGHQTPDQSTSSTSIPRSDAPKRSQNKQSLEKLHLLRDGKDGKVPSGNLSTSGGGTHQSPKKRSGWSPPDNYNGQNLYTTGQ